MTEEGSRVTSTGSPTLLHTRPPPSTPRPPPPLGCRGHTPGQRDAGRLLPCALPRESVSGNFSRLCHGREWPLPPLPHTKTARGGGEGPWVGPPEPLQLRLPTGGWWGPPVRGSSPRHPPSTCRDPLTPPCPPLSPTPAGAARPARAVRARAAPCCIIRAVRAARRAEGPRTAPSAPPPRQLVLKANRRLAGCCAGGARRPGASYPPPTGVCTHGTGHKHPLGGSHTAMHHSTTATGRRE